MAGGRLRLSVAPTENHRQNRAGSLTRTWACQSKPMLPLDSSHASALRNVFPVALGILAIRCHRWAGDRIRRGGRNRSCGTPLAGRGPPSPRRWFGHPGRFRRIAAASRLRRLPQHLGALAERFLLVDADRRRATPDRGRSRDPFAAPRWPPTTSKTDRLKTSSLTLRSRGWVVFMRAIRADRFHAPSGVRGPRARSPPRQSGVL